MSSDGKDALSSSQQQMLDQSHYIFRRNPSGGSVIVSGTNSARLTSPAVRSLLKSEMIKAQQAKEPQILIHRFGNPSSRATSLSTKPTVSLLSNDKPKVSVSKSEASQILLGPGKLVTSSSQKLLIPSVPVHQPNKNICPTTESERATSIVVPVSRTQQSSNKSGFLNFKIFHSQILEGDSKTLTVHGTTMPANNESSSVRKDFSPGLVLQQEEVGSTEPTQTSLGERFVTLQTVRRDKLPAQRVIRNVDSKPGSSGINMKILSSSSLHSAFKKDSPAQSAVPKQVFAVKTMRAKTSTQGNRVVCVNDLKVPLQTTSGTRVFTLRPSSVTSSSAVTNQTSDKRVFTTHREGTNRLVSVQSAEGNKLFYLQPIGEKLSSVNSRVITLQAKQGTDAISRTAINVPFKEILSSDSCLNNNSLEPVMENEVLVHTSLNEECYVLKNEHTSVSGNPATETNRNTALSVTSSQMNDVSVDSRGIVQVTQGITASQMAVKNVIPNKIPVHVMSVDSDSDSKMSAFAESSSVVDVLASGNSVINSALKTESCGTNNVPQNSVMSHLMGMVSTGCMDRQSASRDQKIKFQLVADDKGFRLQPVGENKNVQLESSSNIETLKCVGALISDQNLCVKKEEFLIPESAVSILVGGSDNDLSMKNSDGEVYILKTGDPNGENISQLKILEKLGASVKRESNNEVKPEVMNQQPKKKRNRRKMCLSSREGSNQEPSMFETESLDSENVLDRRGGIEALPGSKLKFCINKSGFMQLVENDGFQEMTDSLKRSVSNENDNSLLNKDEKDDHVDEKIIPKDPEPSTSEKIIAKDPQPSTSEKIIAKDPQPSTSGSRKFKSKIVATAPDDIYHCEVCGCYGLSSEFHTPKFCSISCATSDHILEKEKPVNKEKRQQIKKVKQKVIKLKIDKEQDAANYRKRRKKVLLLLQEKLEKNTALLKAVRISVEAACRAVEVDSLCESVVKPAVKSCTSVKKSSRDGEDYNLSVNRSQMSPLKKPWQTGKSGFSWSKYLERCKAKAAPQQLFKDPFPYYVNGFKAGMKLEGIDPIHPSYVCVLTVKEVRGYRIKLHFDGYSDSYDFWVNADSVDIFPVGWCEKSELQLLPPKDYEAEIFTWGHYLKKTKSQAAPRNLFATKVRNAVCPHGFRKGMKLEALNRKYHYTTCVATVRCVLDCRILIHFDGWGDTYDYWTDISSPCIHPVGWCYEHGRKLHPPKGYRDPESFSWETYLQETKSVAAPPRAFKLRQASGFRKGMKLECVDKRVPALIRVATVEGVKEHRLKISFDGWPEDYNIWMDDDSLDIHPVGWCEKTGHPLEPPLIVEEIKGSGCHVPVCRGVGHIKGLSSNHSSAEDCPYAPENLKKRPLADRLASYLQTTVDSKTDITENIKSGIHNPFEHPLKRRLAEDQWETSGVKSETTEYEEELDTENSRQRKRTFKGTVTPSCKTTGIITRSRKYVNPKDSCKERHAITPLRKKRDAIMLSRKNTGAKRPDNNVYNEIRETVCNPNVTNKALYLWAKHTICWKDRFPQPELPSDLRDWGPQEVCSYIACIPGLQDMAEKFRSLNMDGEAFVMLTQSDLINIIGCKFGQAIKIYNSIVHLRVKHSLL